jgi:hypothetical protein
MYLLRATKHAICPAESSVEHSRGQSCGDHAGGKGPAVLIPSGIESECKADRNVDHHYEASRRAGEHGQAALDKIADQLTIARKCPG